MRKSVPAYVLLLFVFGLHGCVHSNYSGTLAPADTFEVRAVAGAVLGKRHAGVFDGHSYYQHGRYRAGAVTFDAATESGFASQDDEDDSPAYENLRTIQFQGRGGHRYVLRPLPDPNSTILLGSVSLQGQYSGYEVLDTVSNQIVLRVR